ncbi:unnamed protein product [Malus baccata var. baccata]
MELKLSTLPLRTTVANTGEGTAIYRASSMFIKCVTLGYWAVGKAFMLICYTSNKFPTCRGCLGLKGREFAYDTTTWDEHRLLYWHMICIRDVMKYMGIRPLILRCRRRIRSEVTMVCRLLDSDTVMSDIKIREGHV